MAHVTHYASYVKPYMLVYCGLYIVARLIIAFVLRATRRKRPGEQE